MLQSLEDLLRKMHNTNEELLVKQHQQQQRERVVAALAASDTADEQHELNAQLMELLQAYEQLPVHEREDAISKAIYGIYNTFTHTRIHTYTHQGRCGIGYS